jgi:hypothetical protein
MEVIWTMDPRMKPLVIALALCGLVSALPAGATAIPGFHNNFGPQATGPMFHGGTYTTHRESTRKLRALLDLRDEGLALQAGDGGALTPEHRAYLQKKLDAIQAGDY